LIIFVVEGKSEVLATFFIIAEKGVDTAEVVVLDAPEATAIIADPSDTINSLHVSVSNIHNETNRQHQGYLML